MKNKVNELQVLEQNVIVAAFAKRGGSDELYERIAEQARSYVPDVTTKKGRDAIGSVAAKVSSSKKVAEKYAIDLVAEKKAEVKAVDADRISFVKKMDALRDEILAPRDAWVKAEEDRVAKHQHNISEIRLHATEGFLSLTTAELLKGSIELVEGIVVDASYEEFEQEAKLAKLETLEKLRTALVDREKYEAEQEELERLRVAEQKRVQLEHEERIAKEAADKARIEAEAKALAEHQRLEREKKEQAERAESQLREAAEREARLKSEKEAAELRAQNAAEAERKRIESEQVAKAEAERQAEMERIANTEHMRSIHQAVLKSFVDLSVGLADYQIKAIITAIARNQIPNITIKY